MSGVDLLQEPAPATDVGVAAVPPRRRRLWSWPLIIGLVLVATPLLIGLVGQLVIGREGLRVAAELPAARPSAGLPLGADTAGRDVFAMIVYGTPPTYLIGGVAGLVAVGFGTVIGLVSGYTRGIVDTVARGIIDVALGIPALAMAVVIAAVLGDISPLQLGLIVAAMAWAYPARQIRSTVLSLREQQYVVISKLSNEGSLRIMFGEILPNILPFVAAAFVAAVSFSILVAVGLQIIGAGTSDPTLGLVLQLSVTGGALSRGMWWWWAPPAVILSMLFLGLFMVSTAIDQFANPRLRELSGRE